MHLQCHKQNTEKRHHKRLAHSFMGKAPAGVEIRQDRLLFGLCLIYLSFWSISEAPSDASTERKTDPNKSSRQALRPDTQMLYIQMEFCPRTLKVIFLAACPQTLQKGAGIDATNCAPLIFDRWIYGGASLAIVDPWLLALSDTFAHLLKEGTRA